MSTNGQSRSASKKLVESALMVAIAIILSLIKLVDLPYGGSVTIGCMLPVIIIAYRNGWKWGLLTGFVFGVAQQLLGINVLSFVTTWQSILAVILLDYIAAFTITGLGGLFRNRLSQPAALLSGTLFVCALRYVCHVISGATVWAGLSIPTQAALLFSFGYNATYMIPETIVTAVLAYYIGTVIDFGSDQITTFRRDRADKGRIMQWIGGLLLAAAAILDALFVFSRLQNGETGEFDITGLSQVNWPLVGIVTVAGILLFLILHFMAGKKQGEQKA
ncbi:MAG: energy-coupled thiamine transporter ThiT [Lachnospiraceae bacterium]|nr:energy-coupled thiamine transporter ThiT [Lachnospiraceae bacterium]